MQQSSQEHYAFEQNQFGLEDSAATDALVAREQALINVLHAKVRFGACVGSAVRGRYAGALDSVQQNIRRLFEDADGAVGAFSRVRASAIGAGFWQTVDGRSRQREEISTHKSVAAAGAPTDTRVGGTLTRVRPQRILSRVPSLVSSKRARSDETGMVPQEMRGPTEQHGNAGIDDGGCGATAAGADSAAAASEFVSARHQMRIDAVKRHGLGQGQGGAEGGGYQQSQYRPAPQRSGAAHPHGRRLPPPGRRPAAASDDDMDEAGRISDPYFAGGASSNTSLAARLQRPRVGLKRNTQPLHQRRDGPQQQQQQQEQQQGEVDERLRNIDPRMVEMIESEIVTNAHAVTWDDIAGLGQAKRAVHMAVIYPLLKPELFQGIRSPPKGLLLFGPPGTGKTLIGKCIASQAGATFFSISASSLTSKWIGEGEKMVRALFAVARVRQPTVIFIDEIDSLLTQRTDGEQEATRRIKTEFLVQLDGCGTSAEDRIILLGATNRPHELDEAARRRFPKRLYVPLPDRSGRRTIVANLLRKQTHSLTGDQLELICDRTEGYSGADMDTLCREAAFGPIRSITDIVAANVEDVRPIDFADFEYALAHVRPSVSPKDLEIHIQFNNLYGMSAEQGA